MAGHDVAHDFGGASENGRVDDRLLAAEHPVKRVDAFDARSGFVAGDEPRPTERRHSASARLASNAVFVRLNMFINAPSLTVRPNRSINAALSRS